MGHSDIDEEQHNYESNQKKKKYNLRKRKKINYNFDDIIKDDITNDNRIKDDRIKDDFDIIIPQKKKRKLEKDIGTLLELLVEQSNQKMDEIYNGWKKGLTKEQVKKLEPEFNRIMEEIKRREINEIDILKSNLTFNEKVEIMEMYKVFKNTPVDTDEWLKQKIRLYERIKKSKLFNNQDLQTLKIIEEINKNNSIIEEKILRSNYSDNIKAIIYRKYNEIKNLNPSDESYYKTMEWINIALSLPTEIIRLDTQFRNGSEFLRNIYNELNKNIYGQYHVKERIIEIMGSIYSNPDSNRHCIVLLGPPGIGKTLIARSLATAIKLPFYQISFGGAKDSAFLHGHSMTYISAKPGALVEALISMKIKNGILFLDELDKIQYTLEGKEVMSTLLHILDYSQNNEFKDHYLYEIPIDISHLFIIIAINDEKSIDSILLDRLPLLKLEEYTIKDKINISMNYIIPKVLKNLNMKSDEIIISPEIVSYIINKSQIKEKGVRQLERNIYSIFERINVLKLLNNDDNTPFISYKIKDFKIPFILEKQHIDILFNEYNTTNKDYLNMYV